MEEDILKEIKDMEEKKPTNEIVEIDENDEISNTQYDLQEIKDEPKKQNKKKPSKWSKLNKKTKIIIITGIVLVLLIIVILLYFLIFKKSDDNKKPDEPVVVVEKDNYRYEDGLLVFIDENKEELGSYECKNKNENLCYVAYFSNEDDFDTFKKVYENGLPVDIRSDIINDRYVFVYDDETKEDGNVILYDIDKKKDLDTYSLVKEVKDNKVIVKKNNKYGVLDLSNDTLNTDTKIKYDYLGYISDTNYLVTATNGNYSLVDFDDKEVSKSVPGRIMNFDGNNISVKVNNSYYVYGYDGKSVIDIAYDYIRFVNNYVIALDGKKVFVYDKDGNPMNKDGIKINTTDYNTKLIFSDTLRQTGKEEAFSVTVTGSTMRIEFGEEYAKINLNEGLFNKNMPYISYFGGKLYFYSDEEKTDLLGSYVCSYANGVDASTKDLENCFLAKESNILNSDNGDKVGYLPIYNKRFVFIADTKTPNTNDNIILWDLKSNKKLATYKSVDTGFHSDEEVVNFVDTAGTLVVALNTSDSYGVVNIQSSKVSGLIPFKDKDNEKVTNISIKQLGDNFLIKRSDGTYHLFDKNGDELANKVSTTYEIVEYKYDHLMVKNNDLYLIYDLNGKIVSNEFKYISLENKYYVTLDKSNLLGVYKYSNKNNLLSKEIEINDIDKDLNYKLIGDILEITYTSHGILDTISVSIG